MELKRTPVTIAGGPPVFAKGTAVLGAKGMAYLSGSTGVDTTTGKVPEAIGEEVKIALENIKTRLEEYGSSLQYIVHIWIYVKGQFPNAILNDPGWQEIQNAMQEFWKENLPEFCIGNNPPAASLIGVTALARPEYRLEITVFAAIP